MPVTTVVLPAPTEALIAAIARRVEADVQLAAALDRRVEADAQLTAIVERLAPAQRRALIARTGA
jgi:hypothetical protein